jgi:Na+/H+ antiporter NhaC
MSSSRTRWLVAGALLVMGALLAHVTPDRSALRARALVRLLELERGAAPSDATSLFARLDAVVEAAGAPALRLRVSARDPLPGAPRDAASPEGGVDPLRLALESQLEVHNAARERRGLPALAIVAGARDGDPTRRDATSFETESARADPFGVESRDGRDGVAVVFDVELRDDGGVLSLAAAISGGGTDGERAQSPRTWRAPTAAALAPPLIAIGVALLMQRAALALLCGVWAGALCLRLESGERVWAPLWASLDVVAIYARHALVDEFRFQLLAFVVVLAVMIALLVRMRAIDAAIARVGAAARTARQGALAAFGAGLLVFFDDYCNCLLVGSVMRPLMDRLRVAREKLAFIVDSTAAPVAGLSLLSTWIAFEVSVYAPQLPGVGITDSPYSVFVQSLAYRYYSIFALVFVALNALSGRDFGPMRAAELAARARSHDPGEGIAAEIAASSPADPSRPQARARHAILAIATVLLVSLEEIFRRGDGWTWLHGSAGGWPGLAQVVSDGSGAAPLLAGALAGVAVTLYTAASQPLRRAAGAAAATIALLVVGARATGAAPPETWRACVVAALAGGVALLTWIGARRVPAASRRARLGPTDLASAGWEGTRRLLGPLLVLIGAWMLARVCEDARTADYIVALASGAIAPLGLPIVLFLLACGVSFATGTSWGTMSILLPNVVPLAALAGTSHPLGAEGMVLVSIGAVLEGAIFGDHCSPISDTTVLSSVASGCDHLAHVRTQLPYALAVAAVAILCGYLPVLLVPGWPFLGALVAGMLALLGLLYTVGRTVGEGMPLPGAPRNATRTLGSPLDPV